MFEMLSYPFMQRALAAGIIIGFLGSYYGVFVVQRKMSFLGSGLAHAAFGGVALGIFLNTEPLNIAVPFTLIISVLLVYLRDKTRLGIDTAIGVLFSVSVALGIIFLSLNNSYSSDAFAYLFGSILAVKNSDLWISSVLLLITIGTFFGLWGRWSYASFDRELARADKLPVTRDDYLLNILIALTIVLSIKIVGIILIAAFLVIPAASARLLSPTFIRMTILSIIFGVGSVILGLWASFTLDLPSGATIIITEAIIFLTAVLIRGKQ